MQSGVVDCQTDLNSVQKYILLAINTIFIV